MATIWPAPFHESAIFRKNHFTELVDMVEEHVLGAAQTDSFGTERNRLSGLVGLIGIRADL